MSNLDNREPVTLTIGQKLTVLSRTKILIKCLVTGLPKPVIAWNREENQLETSGNKLLNDSVLIIKNITSQDSGLYLCTASNLAGKVSAGSLVYVTGKGQLIQGWVKFTRQLETRVQLPCLLLHPEDTVICL